MDEAFEAWFKELYIREGFVSSKVELYAAWRAATLAERERLRAPTEAMIVAGDDAGWWSGGANGREEAGNVWAAMYAAAIDR